MTEDTVYELEREVEAARSRLADHLSVFRSPDAAADFTRALKQQARSGLDATIASIMEDVKARAAANPAAALAIGAGLAWRLVRHPPIATALIGAGLVSLFRTPPTQAGAGAGYLSQTKTRLRERASQAVDYATEQAAHMSSRARENAAELAAAGKERAREWAAEATSSKQVTSDLQERAASMSSQASELVSEMQDRAAAVTYPYVQSAQQAIDGPEARDKLLLGSAGIAVAAALGIALYRRFGEADGQP